jgi:hypothetical protein
MTASLKLKPISSKLLINALSAEVSSSRWATEANRYFIVGARMSNEMFISKQEVYVNTIGAIIGALMENKRQYPSDLNVISNVEGNTYFQVPYYPSFWGKVCEDCGLEMNPTLGDYITTVGTKIMSGDLFFDKARMTAAFPNLESFFNIIESERKKNLEYQQIAKLFDEALKHQTKDNLSENKKEFLENVARLKEHTLKLFKEDHTEFDFTKSSSLAQRTKDLSDKLMSDKATLTEIDQFKEANKALEGHAVSKMLKIITTILTTLVGIAIGIVAGFAIAGPVGAVVGGVAGGISAASLTLGIFAYKKDPVNQVTLAADTVIADDKSAEEASNYEQIGGQDLTP